MSLQFSILNSSFFDGIPLKIWYLLARDLLNESMIVYRFGIDLGIPRLVVLGRKIIHFLVLLIDYYFLGFRLFFLNFIFIFITYLFPEKE